MAGLWYRVGTVSVTNGSKKVTGFGSQWKSTVYKPDKGHALYGPDGQAYEIDYVESDTVLYLVLAYAGATAASQAYSIDITRTGTIPAFSRELSAQLAYAQSQYDSWQQILTGVDMVTLTAPDGQQVQVPSLLALQPKDATLTAMAGVATSADKVILFTAQDIATPMTVTAAARTVLDDATTTEMLTTLGGYPKSGGSVDGDFWRGGYGDYKLGQVRNLGDTTDAKSSLIVLAKKYAGTLLDKTGFVGRIFFNRGSPGSNLISDYVDVDVSSAYNINSASILYRSGGTVANAKIVEIMYNGALHYALFRPAAPASAVIVTGHSFGGGLPVLIPDANAYGMSDVFNGELLFSRHNIVGIVSNVNAPAGAIIESGSNANGYYVKFANGYMVCLADIPLGVQTLSAREARMLQIGGTSNPNRSWPAGFSATPSVSYSLKTANSGVFTLGIEANTSTLYGGFVLRNHEQAAQSTSSDAIIHIIGCGVWG